MEVKVVQVLSTTNNQRGLDDTSAVLLVKESVPSLSYSSPFRRDNINISVCRDTELSKKNVYPIKIVESPQYNLCI